LSSSKGSKKAGKEVFKDIFQKLWWCSDAEVCFLGGGWKVFHRCFMERREGEGCEMRQPPPSQASNQGP
jgi:hypothetical protein